MHYDIVHDTPGRLRVHCRCVVPNRQNADRIARVMIAREGVVSAELSLRTGNLLILYSRLLPRGRVLEALNAMDSAEECPGGEISLPGANAAPPAAFEKMAGGMMDKALVALARKFLVPAPVRAVIAVCRALPALAKGMWTLLCGRMDGTVLDAAALGFLAVRGDFAGMEKLLRLMAAPGLRAGGRNGRSSPFSLVRAADGCRFSGGALTLADFIPIGLVVFRFVNPVLFSLIQIAAKAMLAVRSLSRSPGGTCAGKVFELTNTHMRKTIAETA